MRPDARIFLETAIRDGLRNHAINGAFTHNGVDHSAAVERQYLSDSKTNDWHPAIIGAVQFALDMGMEVPHTLAYELPSPSESDPKRVAYLRTPDHAAACDGRGRWTVAKPGSFIARHLPAIPGHEVEKILGIANAAPSGLEFLTDDAMVAVMNSHKCRAESCMTHYRHSEDLRNHPYRVYSSALGWSLAILRDAHGIIEARALVNEKRYVRIFGAAEPGTIRADHGGMRGLLERAGIARIDSWRGCRIESIRRADNGDWLLPYLDGDHQYCSLNDADTEFTVDPRGSFLCQSQFGGYDGGDHRGMVQTENGDWLPEDSAIYLENEFVYINAGDAAELNGVWYRRSEVVTYADGTRGMRDDSVRISREWFRADSDLLAWDSWNDRYILAADAVTVEEGWTTAARYTVTLADGTRILETNAVDIGGEWIRRNDAFPDLNGAWHALADAAAIVDAIIAAHASRGVEQVTVNGRYLYGWDADALAERDARRAENHRREYLELAHAAADEWES